MTRGPDKFCLFTDTHPHPFSAQASENVQVSHIFCKSNSIQCGLVAYCLKQPCCKSSCEVNSSPSININVRIQAFKVWEPHLFVCVCACVCVCVCVCVSPCVSSCMCASAFTLAHKRIHEYKLFPFLPGFVVICCWKKTYCS